MLSTTQSGDTRFAIAFWSCALNAARNLSSVASVASRVESGMARLLRPDGRLLRGGDRFCRIGPEDVADLDILFRRHLHVRDVRGVRRIQRREPGLVEVFVPAGQGAEACACV